MTAKLDKVLTTYINSLAKAPVQKSKEWYAIKQTTIGGSEIATVLGSNPFSSVKKLIAEKVGIGNKFNGCTATHWGNLFEHITKKWGEIILKMPRSIKEAGSIQGVIDRQRYSPDGLGVVQLVCLDETKEYFIVLFEFKAPLSSIPSGTIPKHYIPQIQTGLLSIPIAETSIFINNCYRMCALSDLAFNTVYNTKFHDKDMNKVKAAKKNDLTKSMPLACGIIFFYQESKDYHKLYDYMGYGSDSDDSDITNDNDHTSNDHTDNDHTGNDHTGNDHTSSKDNDNTKDIFDILDSTIGKKDNTDVYYNDGDMELLLDTKDSPIDLGNSPNRMTHRVLELYDNHRLHAVYYPIIVNNKEVNDMEFVKTHDLQREDEQTLKSPLKIGKIYLQRFLDKCEENDWCSVAFLPWKLMRSDIIIEDRINNWLEKIEEPVINTLKIIDEIINSKDPRETFDEKFPSKKVDDVEYLQDMADMAAELAADASACDFEDIIVA